MAIEQEFFEAFGIEPKDKYIGKKNEMLCNHCEDNCYGCSNKLYVKNYPPITPEIVLGLITILVKKHCNLTLYWGLPRLTEQILKQCIKDSKDKQIQDQVKALFNA